MSPFQALVLGAIQGVSEFLPISSSAHLYVVPALLHWAPHGLAFDVALHWGTLVALLVCFWRDWWELTRDALVGYGTARAHAWSVWARLAAASVPGAIAGVLLDPYEDTMLRHLPLQAALLALFGFLLWWVDRVRPAGRDARIPGWGACMAIGAAQSFALVPGVSRSGITITTGRAVGLTRVSAARFSFLLATPITLGAGLLKLRHFTADASASTLAIGVIAAALVGIVAIQGLIRFLARAGFGVFFGYRVLLAGLILWRVLAR
jgi:undecaprenyl-diphosphatase